jgi:hypothetical protein
LLPLHGVSVALTAALPDGTLVETEFARQLKAKLDSLQVDWSLVILDPLSRWAAGGVESNNESATRFAQVVETLTGVRGRPSVLVAHHSSQESAQSGKSNARGVTGIKDAFRWMATLDAAQDDNGSEGIILRNAKSNYSAKFKPFALARNTEPGIEGTLRVLSEQVAAPLLASAAGRTVTQEEFEDRVIETVRRHPRLTSATQIAKFTTGTKGHVLDAVKRCLFDGRLVMETGGFFAVGSESPDSEGKNP